MTDWLTDWFVSWLPPPSLSKDNNNHYQYKLHWYADVSPKCHWAVLAFGSSVSSDLFFPSSPLRLHLSTTTLSFCLFLCMSGSIPTTVFVLLCVSVAQDFFFFFFYLRRVFSFFVFSASLLLVLVLLFKDTQRLELSSCDSVLCLFVLCMCADLLRLLSSL